MKKKILLLLSLFIFISCKCFVVLFAPDRYPEKYYSNLSVRNDTNNTIKNISIDTWNNWDGYEEDKKTSYIYDDLASQEKSEYQEILSGFLLALNIATSRYISVLKINYSLNDEYKTLVVFDDGLEYSSHSQYENLTEEELEKVYLKKDTNNTIVISDDGVTLLQGQ